MAVKDKIQIGDPRLKAKNSMVKDFKDSKIAQVIRDLSDSMRSHGQTIGLAAPQIGENYKVFVTEPRETKLRTADQADELRVYINPTIVKYSKNETVIYEGCASVLNGQLFGPVKRSQEIIIEAYNEAGKKFRLTCDGILARVIQHEYDHLSGVEFVEKVCNYRKLITADFYIKDIKESEEQVSASIITKKETVFLQ